MAQTTGFTIRSGFLITDRWLGIKNACPRQRERFKNVYPKGMRLNTRNLNVARSKYRLNTRWLVDVILNYDEEKEMYIYADITLFKILWTTEDTKLLHSAFIKVLGERK